MDDQLTAAAKTLARWCYRRGIDELASSAAASSGFALGWFGACVDAGEDCLDPACGQGEDRGGQADEGLHRATLSWGRSPARGIARFCSRSPGEL